MIYKLFKFVTRTIKFSTNLNMPKVLKYGSWKSPITSELITSAGIKFNEVQLDQNNLFYQKVYWSESHAKEGGRTIVFSYNFDSHKIEEWTPKDFNLYTKVHEYGGNAFIVNKDVMYFSNKKDNRIYAQVASLSTPYPITKDDQKYRYTDFVFDNINQVIICVCEYHDSPESEPENFLCCLNLKANNTICCLQKGADFYASPSLSSDSSLLTWVEWNHPNMPWDCTNVKIASFHVTKNLKGDSASDFATLSNVRMCQLNPSINVSYMQPCLRSPKEKDPRGEGKYDLIFLSDADGFYKLYQAEIGTEIKFDKVKYLIPLQAKLCKDIGYPHWVSGDTAYAINPKDRNTIVFAAENDLYALTLNSDELTGAAELLEKVICGQLNAVAEIHNLKLSWDGKSCFCLIYPKTGPEYVASIDLLLKKITPIKKSCETTIDPAYISLPQEIEYPSGDGCTAYAFYYAPKNKDFLGPTGTLPPLLVTSHGGPTAKKSDAFNLRTQYYTSRGFAVLDVNYRGSSGYGKSYRNALYKNWGLYDVEDCCAGALYLARVLKCVDENKLCIDGGSAGGYTTLACLTFRPEVFKAGVSRYGIGDLCALATDTHKFEKYYNDKLIGPFSTHSDVWRQRSPINHCQNLSAPVAFFHGTEDKVVPMNQAQAMYEKLKAKGIPTALVLFEGEGHGFRAAKNIKTALDGEIYFYAKIFGFEPDIPAEIREQGTRGHFNYKVEKGYFYTLKSRS